MCPSFKCIYSLLWPDHWTCIIDQPNIHALSCVNFSTFIKLSINLKIVLRATGSTWHVAILTHHIYPVFFKNIHLNQTHKMYLNIELSVNVMTHCWLDIGQCRNKRTSIVICYFFYLLLWNSKILLHDTGNTWQYWYTDILKNFQIKSIRFNFQ